MYKRLRRSAVRRALACGDACGRGRRRRQARQAVRGAGRLSRPGLSWLSLRADDHPDPLAELRRLYAVAQERYIYVADTMATRDNPSGMVDRSEIDATIIAVEKARIAEGRSSASFATPLKIE